MQPYVNVRNCKLFSLASKLLYILFITQFLNDLSVYYLSLFSLLDAFCLVFFSSIFYFIFYTNILIDEAQGTEILLQNLIVFKIEIKLTNSSEFTFM